MPQPDPALEAAFYAQITHDIIHGINDWSVYSMYADVLEECNLLRYAKALRWQAAHQKRPLAVGGVPPCRWYNALEYQETTDPASNLPVEIFEQLCKLREPRPYYIVGFETVRDAEEGFITAFWLAVALRTFDPDKIP